MKKLLWGLLFFVVLLGAYWFLSAEHPRKKEHQKALGKVFTETQTKKVSRVEGKTAEVIHKKHVRTEVNDAKNDETKLSCTEKYQQKPEWKEIEAILTSVYMGGDYAAGEGTYQQIPLEAVKSYADAGDKEAMLHYGSQAMWKAALGIHLNSINRDGNLSSSELRERVKRYQPNFEKFHEGANYAYRAAVQGKFGAYLEITAMSNSLIRRMVESASSLAEIEKALIYRHSFLSVMEKVHQNDPGFLIFFSGDDELQKNLKVIYKDQPLKPEQLESLQNKIQQNSKQLLQQWEVDRLKLGLDPYPDLITPRLDQFLKDMEQECR